AALPIYSSTRYIPTAPPAQSNDTSLPTAHISRRGSVLLLGLDSLHGLHSKRSIPWDPLPPWPPHAAPHIMDQCRHHERANEDRVEQHRSEERRVGKEGRSRRGREHEKRKKRER